VIPHVHVHRRSDDYGSLGGQVQRAKKIFGDAMRKFSENVRGGGSDEQEIDALGDRDVFDRAFDVGWCTTGCGEEIGDDFLSSESGEGKGGNELLRTTGHDDLNVELFLLQAADKFRGLIRCDASGDPKRDSHSSSAASLLFSPALFALCGAYFQVRSFVLEVTPLQFFFGDARSLARPWIFDERPGTNEQLTGAARYYNDISKLAVRCFPHHCHGDISLQKTSKFRESAFRFE
jgi:hypothetical protein